MVKLRNIVFFCLLSLSASGLSSLSASGLIPFRGAWIATVANIDWPTEEAIGNTELQKQEMIFILDSLQSLGINAIIFQVRPTADALYQSPYEPVSHWLTGKQGSWEGSWEDTISPFMGEEAEDPLSWTINEAHARNMEVHVWLNPYRLNLARTDTSEIAENHIWRQHRDWFWEYNKQWYFDPGLDATREWICTIVQDIVTRYDIQAIHMDDYFYPYPSGKLQIPDKETFKRLPRGFTDIREWRRDNVNLAIKAISETIRECKPGVEFGISPFGVWRNAAADSTGSRTQAGITNYDHLYADIRLWIKNGWIDYVLPQLYWEIGKKAADYEILAKWWANEVRGTKCKLYIGMAAYRLEGAKRDTPWGKGNEIARQMRLNRTIPEITGECFYSVRPLLRNPRHVCDSIRAIYTPSLPIPEKEQEEEEFVLPWE